MNNNNDSRSVGSFRGCVTGLVPGGSPELANVTASNRRITLVEDSTSSSIRDITVPDKSGAVRGEGRF